MPEHSQTPDEFRAALKRRGIKISESEAMAIWTSRKRLGNKIPLVRKNLTRLRGRHGH
ncbi:MAG TPA: hypothetical protein VJH23_00050 [archaeon]|nr:hypothetical protein [archaeon]